MEPQLRLAEFVATLALAQDNAFGQPLESQLRSCLLASWICEAAGFEERRARDRLLGGAAAVRRLHRPRARGRDAVRRRDRDPRPDARPRRRATRPRSWATSCAFATAGRSDEERDEIIRMLQETAHEWAVHNFTSGCEVADMLVAAARLRPGRPRGARLHVRALERQGLPDPRERRGDPARRCASCTSATTWRRSAASSRRSAPSRPPAIAATAPTTRRSPTCSSSTGASGSTGSARSSRGTPCSPSSPSRAGCSTGDALDHALTVAADFIDLKSPYMGGHSRRCAQLATDAARVLGLAGGARSPRSRRAALVHDFGTTARLELDLGQAGPAHADGVRPRRAAPDADRADAAPLAGAGRAEPGRLGAPREVRRLRVPQARARRHERRRRHACWPRPRSTWG